MKEITKPENYTDREPAPAGLDLVSRIHGRFKGMGIVMPEAQRQIYEQLTQYFIEDVKKFAGFPKRIHKPTVVDVGCGLGIGSNILSREAQFVWGIDISDEDIKYARQMFAREPNNIYYTPQITFDTINILEEPREFMKFDYVVCIEVMEHLRRSELLTLTQNLNRFVKKHKKGGYIEDDSRTKIFISTPNRNAPHLGKETPINEHHCYEITAGEGYEFFTQHYKAVTILNSKLEPVDLDTQETPIVFKLEMPIC